MCASILAIDFHLYWHIASMQVLWLCASDLERGRTFVVVREGDTSGGVFVCSFLTALPAQDLKGLFNAVPLLIYDCEHVLTCWRQQGHLVEVARAAQIFAI